MDSLSPPLRRKALRQGFLLLPTDLSWRRAQQVVQRGHGAIYPFHQRWQGRLDFTDAGRAALARAEASS